MSQSHSVHVVSSIARVQVCARRTREGRESLACVAPQNAALGVLLRATACAVAALAACARECGAMTHCSCGPSRMCWLAAVCGRLQSVLPLTVQTNAGLCWDYPGPQCHRTLCDLNKTLLIHLTSWEYFSLSKQKVLYPTVQ